MRGFCLVFDTMKFSSLKEFPSFFQSFVIYFTAFCNNCKTAETLQRNCKVQVFGHGFLLAEGILIFFKAARFVTTLAAFCNNLSGMKTVKRKEFFILQLQPSKNSGGAITIRSNFEKELVRIHKFFQ